MIYKSLHNLTPDYMNDRLIPVSDTNYSLRSAANLNLKLDKLKTNTWKRSLTYSGSDLWNKLHLQIHLKTNVIIFFTLGNNYHLHLCMSYTKFSEMTS